MGSGCTPRRWKWSGWSGWSHRLVRPVVVALLVGAFVPAGVGAQGTGQAAQTWDVQAGLDDMTTFGSAQAFGPDPVIIRAGDTVRWTMVGFHTVTFLSGKPQPTEFVPGPAAGELTLGPAFFPVGVSGAITPYGGTQQLSSGAPIEPPAPGASAPTFSARFTQPGLFGYVCILHPGMRGEVEVRAADAALPETPAQAKTRGQVTLAALAAKPVADAQQVRPFSIGDTHVALAGLGDGFGASALRFINGNRTVRRGDTVVWTVGDPFEIHTITFTSGGAPPEFIEPRPQPQGPPLLVVPANVVGPQGGETYAGTGYANSGILTSGNSYALRFDAPPGAYQYLCLVHPFMTGTITVSG